MQRGGFLLPLLSAVLPALAILIFKYSAMLRKMYLVPANQLHKHRHIPPTSPAKKPTPEPPAKKPKRPKPLSRRRKHSYEKWVRVQQQIREDEMERKLRVKAVADFLKSVLPPPAVHKAPIPRRQTTPTQTEARVAAAAIPSTSSAAEIYQTPKSPPNDDDVNDDDVAEGFVEE